MKPATARVMRSAARAGLLDIVGRVAVRRRLGRPLEHLLEMVEAQEHRRREYAGRHGLLLRAKRISRPPASGGPMAPDAGLTWQASRRWRCKAARCRRMAICTSMNDQTAMSLPDRRALPILIAPQPGPEGEGAPGARPGGRRRACAPWCRACSPPCTAAPGIGLAAPQVGVGLRLAVVDLMPDEKPAPIVLINPEIVVAASQELATREEGCLSLPGQYADVTRPARVKVRYLDENGARAGDRGRGPARRLPAARDRPSRRRAVRRPPLGAEAQHDPAPAGQGAAAEAAPTERVRLAFMGSPDFARAGPARAARGRARDRRRLLPAAAPGRPRPRHDPLPGACGGRGAGAAGAHAGPAAARRRGARGLRRRSAWMRRWWPPTG